jgi:ascorbate-specific PTS system EIIC-type component UlaA
VAVFNMMIAQIVIFLFTFLIIWLAIPLFFSPHGIFAKEFSAPRAVVASLRLSRAYLPGTSLFILAVITLSQGLDMIWQIAPPSSWMTLVGIFGHAFVNTGLVAATFVFYRDAVRWYDARRESAFVSTVPQDPPAAGG